MPTSDAEMLQGAALEDLRSAMRTDFLARKWDISEADVKRLRELRTVKAARNKIESDGTGGFDDGSKAIKKAKR